MFTYRTRVAMHDTDAAGIVYFATFFHYAEEAESHAMASLGIILTQDAHLYPRVHVSCDYHAPLHFFEEVRVEARLVAVGSSSMTWEFLLYGEKGLCATVKAISSRRRRDGTAAPYTAEEKAAFQPLQ